MGQSLNILSEKKCKYIRDKKSSSSSSQAICKICASFSNRKKSVRAAAKILFEKYYLDFGFSNHILHDRTKTKSIINLIGDHSHQSLLNKYLPYYEIMVFVKQ